MSRGSDGSYAASLDARVDSGKDAANLKVWMEAGDDRMEIAPITVVPRLMIKSVQATLSPPPYVTNQKATVVDLSTAPAMAADGSRVSLNIIFNKPLAKNSSVDLVPASDEMHAPAVQWHSDASARSAAHGPRKKFSFPHPRR